MNDDKRTMQNLVSLSILLAGLLVGSLSIDVMQLFTESGFSKHVTQKNDVLETRGKTWVAYTDPLVSLTVLTDTSCAQCNPNQALTWIRRIMPTTIARTVEYSSEEGQRLALTHQIAALPAFLFSESIKEVGFYQQAGELFTETEGLLTLDMTKIGETPGKFLKLPSIEGDDISIGSVAAPITIIEYSDFQCPYSKLFQSAIQKIVKEYPNDVRFIYKHLPLSFHPQAQNAALAGECANEQGKFQMYADHLFTKQDEWAKTTGTQKFKDFSWKLGLNGRDFAKCLDTKKYTEKVISDSDEAKTFGITGTPGTFVNDQFINGAISYDELKSIIDKKLAE